MAHEGQEPEGYPEVARKEVVHGGDDRGLTDSSSWGLQQLSPMVRSFKDPAVVIQGQEICKVDPDVKSVDTTFDNICCLEANLQGGP